MLLSRNYPCTNQTNTNKNNDNDREVEEIQHDSSGKLFADSYIQIRRCSAIISFIRTTLVFICNKLTNIWKLHAVYFSFRTLVFILLLANDQSGQVLTTMKETRFGLATQGALNRYARSIKSTQKKVATKNMHLNIVFKLQNMPMTLAAVLLYEK